jgi:hypothetical protein
MNSINILEYIIDKEGNCEGLPLHKCNICPLAKLSKKEDGSYMSCIESTGTMYLNIEDSNKIYLKHAIEQLINLTIDNILSEEDVERKG